MNDVQVPVERIDWGGRAALNRVGTRSTASLTCRGNVGRGGTRPYQALASWLLGCVLAFSPAAPAAEAPAVSAAELTDVSLDGSLTNGRARLVIQALLKNLPEDKKKLVYVGAFQHLIRVAREKLTHQISATFDILQGEPEEIVLTLTGEGTIKSVTGTNLLFWNVRQETNQTRSLVLVPMKTGKPLKEFAVAIVADTDLEALPVSVTPLGWAAPHAALFKGFVRVLAPAAFAVEGGQAKGLVQVDLEYLPAAMQAAAGPAEPEPLAFRFQGGAYALPLRVARADPDARQVVLRDFKLVGRLSDSNAAFTLTATVRVNPPEGGTLELLSGNVALREVESGAHWRLKFDNGRFTLVADQAGEFPLRLRFDAAVRQNAGWNRVDFRLAPSALQPVVLQGLKPDTQFQMAGAAKPERLGSEFATHLSPDGHANWSWKETRPEAEGKLFYSAEMLCQISVSPGLMRQVALLEGKVMQGELTRLVLGLRGDGQVTRVQGDQVLSWNVEPVPNSADRRLAVQFNQPQKDKFAFQVQLQTPLGAFPQTFGAVQWRPENAVRFAGYYRIVNEGAVRLEVAQAIGLSQISPEQFPESAATKAVLGTQASQRFAFRFSSVDCQLRIQADNILPELSVSEVLAYHLGDTEQTIEAELELDIREAPLRELLLLVPKGYVLARLTVPGLNDYFLTEPEGAETAQLRLVYGQPTIGRQVLQLRLERNKPHADPTWLLPRVEVSSVKSTRGQLGVSAAVGYRLAAESTQGLTEVATAFFPRKVAGLQAAFRLSDAAWQATLRIERLPQSVQADVFHLFSIGEGIAYGSSTMNYVISGAPIALFKVELSGESLPASVEFTGKDIRNWQKVAGGYEVQLHTPVTGTYTLLASYERPFKAQGDTLTFTGARPSDAQTEQGHTIVVSAYQFQVRPASVSAGLLPLDPGEVPAEYRLFFDAPILAAYRYTSRPFNLQLALSPLTQGETLSQVVDRAALATRISKEGEVLTDVTYYVKNRGQPHFRMTLPAGTELWDTLVNGLKVIPARDAASNLIPLPQQADPNAVLKLDLKLASRSKRPQRVLASAPRVAAPVMLVEWKFEPDTRRRLVYRAGTLTPVGGVSDVSGFATVARLMRPPQGARAVPALVFGLAGVVLAIAAWRWGGRRGGCRYDARHLTGMVVGGVLFAVGLVSLGTLASLAAQEARTLSGSLAFVAPVQQANSELSVDVANLAQTPSAFAVAWRLWPVLVALLVWGYSIVTARTWFRPVGWVLGWTLLGWAALRCPNGAPAFFIGLGVLAIVAVAIPALKRLWQMPPRTAPPAPPAPPAPEPGAGASAVAVLVLSGLLGLGLTTAQARASRANTQAAVAPAIHAPDARVQPSPALLLAAADTAPTTPGPRAVRRPKRPAADKPVLAESVRQQLRVEDKFAVGMAKIRWQAEPDQQLPLLREPGVLTRVVYPAEAMRLVQLPNDPRRTCVLLAQKAGTFDLEVHYQVHVTRKDGESGFALPTQYGLVNEVQLTLVDLDVDVASPAAVSTQQQPAASGTNTMATLVLSPLQDAWIGWKPRSRDVRREKAEFYAELFQLYAPTPGVIEGLHLAHLRPARGEVAELTFDVPDGATIIDVVDPAQHRPPADAKNSQAPGTSLISLWRFDPDTRKLRVSLSPAQSRPFQLAIYSQLATGPLPFSQSVGLITVSQAAGQPLGQLGIATGPEVQLDDVAASALSPILLEDFPAPPLQLLGARLTGLALRRAFRYSDLKATVALKAAAVQPDVRVTTQETLSLGEDRVVLAANVGVAITRAGIFRLSFVLPAGMDVESLSGSALSHWTEAKTNQARLITLHLKGKTEGAQQFAISLAGPGLRAVTNWTVPRFVVREATKQRGQLIIVPEQGLRLQAAASDGVAAFDPQEASIRQKGVLAFRLQQVPWSLALNIEQVPPWIQVASLQHVLVSEAQMKVSANLHYQIENTGLKLLHVRLPTNAESVLFKGEQLSDFLRSTHAPADGAQEWEVKLHRRVIGKYALQVSYQVAVPEQATHTVVRGPQAADADLHRGFLTLQSGDRLQIRAGAVPLALQPTEWQSIPRALLQDLPATAAHLAFRLVDPAFALALQIERHEAAKLLPARVNSTTLTSVISDDGVMLTHVQMAMLPGDKRLLHLTLPANAQFWFAFVNQNGVWPWTTATNILIPLEQQSRAAGPMAVEFFYSSRIGAARSRSLNLELLGPKFDLPIENIAWRVYLNEKWKLADWDGTLQLQEDRGVARPGVANVETYLATEASLKQEKTREAEQMLAMGNSWLKRGDPQQARRAFQAAYGLSTHDDAFNEDARVQLHNLKLQQALMGLNLRQATVAGETDAAGSKLRDLRGRKGSAYTQQEARQIIDSRSAEENAAFMRLAERLVQQQDAAVASATAIRANIPQQGRLLTFRRTVQVNPWADMRIALEAHAVQPASLGLRFLVLTATFALLGFVAWVMRLGQARRENP
ncbi:MAG: hypothetical protein JXQ71_15485 [Verrucomicrobia bacterium]|nr:hypothetical protein [Verrucomicrobiota bacterium]